MGPRLVLALVFAGCGTGDGSGGDGGADSGPSDGGFHTEGGLGDPCRSRSDCVGVPGAMCPDHGSYADFCMALDPGTCTIACTADPDCGEALCSHVVGWADGGAMPRICLPRCEDNHDCRLGWRCADFLTSERACEPPMVPCG